MAWTVPTTRSTGYTVTAANWNDFANDFAHLDEIAYTEFTSSVSVTATTEGTANAVVSSGAISYEAVPTLIEFYARSIRPATDAVGRTLTITLFDSTTSLGNIAAVLTPAANALHVPCYGARILTPTAASHTYNFKAYVSGSTGSVTAGAGGPGNELPGFIRITRVPT